MMLNQTNRSQFRTLLDAITLNSDDDAREAIIYLETEHTPIIVTRRDFRQSIRAHAAALRQMGIAPRDLVVIAHTQNLESIYAFWGALLLGAIPSMFPTLTEKLDATIYMHSMAELARRSEVRAIFTTDAFAPALCDHVPCPVFGSEQLAVSISRSEIDAFVSYVPDADEIAFLQHSSGTTGLQKGVALSHRSVLNQLAATATRWR